MQWQSLFILFFQTLIVRVMGERMKHHKISKMIAHIGILLYGASMAFLFYKQTGWSGGAVYESDLPVHIKMIVDDGWYYSLTAFVYKALYLLPFTLPDGAPFGNLAIAVFLALCGLFSVYLTAFLLRDMQKSKAGEFTAWHLQKDGAEELTVWHLLGALILNLVMPCYVRGIADGRYIGMESASIWHNSTYIVMKMLGLCCILYYGKLAGAYQQGMFVKQWFVFTLLLSACTAVKPSFLVVFAPVMAIFLLIDLLQKTPFQRVFLLGSTVFLPMLVVLFQNMVLFSKETGNGWEIRPGYALTLHSGYPFLSAALSVLFPLILLLLSWKEIPNDRWLLLAWLMAAVGFLEVFLFTETGSRASDGNFMWGYSFAILLIFAVALARWAESAKRMLREENRKRRYFHAGMIVVSGLALFWHLYCGIYFYTHLLQGVSYYMWD